MSTAERTPWPRDPRYLVGADGSIVGPRGRVLQGVLRDGYRAISIRRNGRSTLHSVHVIVCETFYGPRPLVPGVRIEVAHDNGDPLDNRACNLKWSTALGNNGDRVRHGTMPYGVRSGSAKLTDDRVRQIRAAVAAGASYRPLAARHGVSATTIGCVVRRETWPHLP